MKKLSPKQSKELWTCLNPEIREYLREKYIDLIKDRDPLNPYDDWADVSILEEIFGEDNLRSTEEPPEMVMIPLDRIKKVVPKEIIPELLNQKPEDCIYHDKCGCNCLVYWPSRCILETGEIWCRKHDKKEEEI